ncbi:MAG TPA: carbon-nitrogen family hydrolase [Bacteroidetes bacterium]|nr:carbon-nitrogen family hydrolase [Bacteroidota bacterium]
MKNVLKIALAQWNVREGDLDHNTGKLAEMAARAGDQKSDLMLIPEMWYIGYEYSLFNRLATGFDAGAFTFQGELARKHSLAICGSSVRCERGKFFNTMAFYDHAGDLILHYDKMFLFAPMGEAEHFSSGRQIAAVEWHGWKIGLAMCYDLRFPELFRAQVKQGVQLFLLSAQWPVTRIAHWDLLLRARAVENQAFVAGCNRTGENPSYQFPGKSAVINPGGEQLIKTDDREGLWVTEIDIDDLFESRRSLPFLDDMRDDL